MKPAAVVGSFVLFGVAGWVIENVKRGPTFSKAFNGARVPFLPVYAFGGLAVVAAAPYIRNLPIWQRFFLYGVATTAVEGIAGIIDRVDGDRPSWDYNGSPINLGYSLLWASGALLVEQAVIVLGSKK